MARWFNILAILLSSSSVLVAQNQANIWYFGDGQGIDFNNQGPFAISDSFTNRITEPVPSTICDSLGNEVLLSNGFVMRNGKTKKESGLPGLFDYSETSSILNNYIIQNPGDRDAYFVFSSSKDWFIDSNQQMKFKGSSRYQHVRFIGPDKDSLIQVSPAQEFLNKESFIAAYENVENNFYWVAVFLPVTGRLYIHKLSSSGLAFASNAYWVDTTGLNPEVPTGASNWNGLTFSSDGSQLAFATGYNSVNSATLCNFDQNNGTISGIRKITDVWPITLEFSYSGEFLYVSRRRIGGDIYQCNTQFTNSISLSDTNKVRLIAKTSNYANALIGPDRKIYLGPRSGPAYLGIIHNPDLMGTACRFDSSGLKLNDTSAVPYLPRYVLSSTFRPTIWSSGFCLGDSTHIQLFNLEADSAILDWGDGTSVAAINDNFNHRFLSEGTYTLHYVYFRNGVADTFEHVISINELNELDLGQDTLVCTNSPVILDASDPYAESYSWNNGGTGSSITASGEGNYAVVVKNGKCLRSDTIRIREVDCNLQISGFCFDDTTRFESSALSVDSVFWDYGDGSTSNKDSLLTSHLYSDSGTYICTLTLFRDGLKRSVTQTISIIKTPIPDIGPDTLLCNLEEYTIDAQDPDYTDYLWSTGSTASNIMLNQTEQIWLRAGKSGCFAFDSAKVYFINCAIESDSLCFGQTSVFEALEKNLDSISWEMGDGTVLRGNPVKYPYAIEGNFSATATLYYLSLSRNILIHVTITKIADPILLNEVEICENTIFALDDIYTNYTYTWNNGKTGPEIKFDSSGHYILRVESNGCTLDDSVLIKLADCSCIIYIPNAFTPDNNGLNETFSPSISCVPEKYSMQIFNRWGELIFESLTIEKGWDGTYKNKPSEPGVYVFIINYTSTISRVLVASKGAFLLLK